MWRTGGGMIRWRRKSDGFEWHKHIRTTVRIRRDKRRQRIDDARHLAVEGVKEAGRAGAAAGSSGLSFAGRALRTAASALAAALSRLIAVTPLAWMRMRAAAVEGSRAAWRIAREVLGTGTRALRRGLNAAGKIAVLLLAVSREALSGLLLRACGPIQSPGVQPLLALVGAIAIVAALIRMIGGSLAADAIFTLVIGLMSAVAAVLPKLLGVQNAWQRGVAVSLPRPSRQPGRFSLPRISFPLPSARAAGLSATVVVAVLGLLGGGWLAWQGATQLASAASSTGLFSQTIEGRAEAVTGDIIRVGKTEIRLDGIEAPEPLQRCAIPGNRRWRCGVAARSALSRTLRGRTVACRVSGSDETGRAFGTCTVGDQDLAQALVRSGLAFADTGLFSRYGSVEEEARTDKAGLWRGQAERPSEYRARIADEMTRAWEVAKRRAPRGCPIKGRIVSGRKYYVLPGTVDYRRARIRTRRGERWFCSEEEALAAGWKRSPRS